MKSAQSRGGNGDSFERVTAVLVSKREPQEAICLELTYAVDSGRVDEEHLLIPHRVLIPLNDH